MFVYCSRSVMMTAVREGVERADPNWSVWSSQTSWLDFGVPTNVWDWSNGALLRDAKRPNLKEHDSLLVSLVHSI